MLEPGLWLPHRLVRIAEGLPGDYEWHFGAAIPQPPRHAPTTRAATTLGMRRERTITSAVGSPLSVKRTLTSVENSRLAVPKMTPTMQPASRATARPISTKAGDPTMGRLRRIRPWLPLPRQCAAPDCVGRLHGLFHASDHLLWPADWRTRVCEAIL